MPAQARDCMVDTPTVSYETRCHSTVKPFELLVEQFAKCFRRHIAAGEAGTAGRDDDVDGRDPRSTGVPAFGSRPCHRAPKRARAADGRPRQCVRPADRPMCRCSGPANRRSSESAIPNEMNGRSGSILPPGINQASSFRANQCIYRLTFRPRKTPAAFPARRVAACANRAILESRRIDVNVECGAARRRMRRPSRRRRRR